MDFYGWYRPQCLISHFNPFVNRAEHSVILSPTYAVVVLGNIDFWKPIQYFLFETDIFDISTSQSFVLLKYFGMILPYFGTYKVQTQQKKLLPRSDSTFSDRYWPILLSISIFRYFDIHFWSFSKPILQFFCKSDTIYWFIAQHCAVAGRGSFLCPQMFYRCWQKIYCCIHLQWICPC